MWSAFEICVKFAFVIRFDFALIILNVTNFVHIKCRISFNFFPRMALWSAIYTHPYYASKLLLLLLQMGRWSHT